MVSPERLAGLQMAGEVGAAVAAGRGPSLSLPSLCGCGKPTSHRGMCSVRWAKRKEHFGPTGNKPKTADINSLLLAARPNMQRIAMGWSQGDETKADDLVSQATLKILENQHQFQPGTNFAAWATTIMKNCRMDGFRRQRDHVGLTIETDGEEIERVDSALQAAPLQESGIIAADMARDFAKLPEAQKRAMVAAVNETPYEQIARDEGVSVGTVKSRISRGRTHLNGGEARVIPAVSRRNADALDFVLSKLREEQARITSAITSLEQCRSVFKGVR